MGKMVPKGPRANVSDMEAARRKKGGKPGGLGYDPAAGQEHASATYRQEYDPLAPEGMPGYDERRFYTRSVDANGHGEKMQVRVPQGVDAQIYGAVRDIPEYRHVNDFWRDAAVHRLEYLQRRHLMSPAMLAFLQLERWQADLERHDAEIIHKTALIDDVAAKLERAWGAEDYGLFALQLEEAERQVDALRDPYQRRLIAVLKEWRHKGRAELERLRQEQED